MPDTATGTYLTPTGAAAVLGCSADTVHRAIGRGDLPAIKYGRMTRIARVDFDAFLRRYQAAAAPRRRART